MRILKWIIIIITVLNFGYMNFDGARGLIVGDYVRPASGEYAGQLGPWTEIVSAVGIKPESTLMKWIFLIWGAIGLILAVSFAMDIRKAAVALLIISALTVWYLVPGTIISLLSVILLSVYLKQS